MWSETTEQFFIAVPVAGASVLCRWPIVNKREGRTEINTKLEILYLDFSVEIANNFAASLCTDIWGRLYTGFVCRSWVVKLDKSVVVCQLSEEKQTKIIYVIVYRNTINVSDSQIACVKTPTPLLKKNRGVFSQAKNDLVKCCLISYPDLTLFYTGRGRSGYEIKGCFLCNRPLYTKLSLGDLCSRLD